MSYEEELDRLRHSPRPLSLIFGCDGFLVPPKELNNLSSPINNVPTILRFAFKQIFVHYPERFLRIEHSLQIRCYKLGVEYIPPKPTDSAEKTLKRKASMNRAIKSAARKLRRESMTKEERKKASAEGAERRRKKTSNESVADRKKRLKNEADRRKKQGDRKFAKLCRMRKVPCPPPRKDGDTGSMTRSARKICRDAIDSLKEEEERRRKEEGDFAAARNNRIFLEWAQRKGYTVDTEETEQKDKREKIYLPDNAEGPGIKQDIYKYGYGREAAMALHSAIKNDIKNGKSTVYYYRKTGCSWGKRCKGFVCQDGKTYRCRCIFNEEREGKGDLCRGCARQEEEDAIFISSLPSKYVHGISWRDSERLEKIEMKKKVNRLCGI